mgnify:CR=1 FL=1
MSTDSRTPRTASRNVAWLPVTVNKTVQRLAVLSLIGQSLLIVTGGAVRLTASGLGCPTWPRCTDSSLVNTPEMGIHGIIEFGNRLLTFALAAVAVAMLVYLWNLRKERRDLFLLALGLLGWSMKNFRYGSMTLDEVYRQAVALAGGLPGRPASGADAFCMPPSPNLLSTPMPLPRSGQSRAYWRAPASGSALAVAIDKRNGAQRVAANRDFRVLARALDVFDFGQRGHGNAQGNGGCASSGQS